MTIMQKQENAALEERLRREVEDLHAFIAAWFRGEVDNDQSTFDTGLGNRLADGLINIQPSGQSLSRADLLEPLFAAHGANPDFNLSIRDFRLLHLSPDGTTAVAVYVEDQTGALNTVPADNSRMTTVLFDVSNDMPLWLHLHETAVP